jgi:hypothetical protein
MTTYYFFRDQLTIDDSLPDQLAALGITPSSDDTMVLGAAACQLNSLPAGWDYLIMADSLSTAPDRGRHLPVPALRRRQSAARAR